MLHMAKNVYNHHTVAVVLAFPSNTSDFDVFENAQSNVATGHTEQLCFRDVLAVLAMFMLLLNADSLCHCRRTGEIVDQRTIELF